MLHSKSRYLLSDVYIDDADRVYTAPRNRLFYSPDVDNVVAHTVEDGDTLKSIAFTYYRDKGFRGTTFWWAIADFQPTPILDPTCKLKVGELIFVPPLNYIEQALGEPVNAQLT
jgi:hypothetical protein